MHEDLINGALANRRDDEEWLSDPKALEVVSSFAARLESKARENPLERSIHPLAPPSQWTFVDRDDARCFEDAAITFLKTCKWGHCAGMRGPIAQVVATDAQILNRGEHAVLFRVPPADEYQIPLAVKIVGGRSQLDDSTWAYQGNLNCNNQSKLSPNTTIRALTELRVSIQCAFHLQGSVVIETPNGPSVPFYFQVTPDLTWGGKNEVCDLFDPNNIERFPAQAVQIRELQSYAVGISNKLVQLSNSGRLSISADYHIGNEVSRDNISELQRQFLLIRAPNGKVTSLHADLDHVDVILNEDRNFITRYVSQSRVGGTIPTLIDNPMPVQSSIIFPINFNDSLCAWIDLGNASFSKVA